MIKKEKEALKKTIKPGTGKYLFIVDNDCTGDRMTTPVYLRDLNEEHQKEQLKDWKRKGKRNLIIAFIKGKDIIIGHYCETPEVS